MLQHILGIFFGLLLIMLGLWGGHTFPKPYDTLCALCAPIGLLATLTGVILLFIPDFFS